MMRGELFYFQQLEGFSCRVLIAAASGRAKAKSRQSIGWRIAKGFFFFLSFLLLLLSVTSNFARRPQELRIFECIKSQWETSGVGDSIEFQLNVVLLNCVILELERRRLLERLGEAFLLVVLDEFSGALQSLGSDLFGFLHNLGSVYQEMKSTSSSSSSSSQIDSNRYDISFSCVPELGRLTLHFRTATAACGYLWAGILKVTNFSLHFSLIN